MIFETSKCTHWIRRWLNWTKSTTLAQPQAMNKIKNRNKMKTEYKNTTLIRMRHKAFIMWRRKRIFHFSFFLSVRFLLCFSRSRPSEDIKNHRFQPRHRCERIYNNKFTKYNWSGISCRCKASREPHHRQPTTTSDTQTHTLKCVKTNLFFENERICSVKINLESRCRRHGILSKRNGKTDERWRSGFSRT